MARKRVATMTRAGMTTSIGYSPKDLEKIRARAYHIWESKGRPANSDMAHWFEAEKALRKEKAIG
jgi:hypothetical protein